MQMMQLLFWHGTKEFHPSNSGMTYVDISDRRKGRYVLLIIKSGLKTPAVTIPTPDFAVPYEAPKAQNTMDTAQPMAPKNGY